MNVIKKDRFIARQGNNNKDDKIWRKEFLPYLQVKVKIEYYFILYLNQIQEKPFERSLRSLYELICIIDTRKKKRGSSINKLPLLCTTSEILFSF